MAYLRDEDNNNESTEQGMNQNADQSGGPQSVASPGGMTSNTASNAPTGGGQTPKPASSGMGASFRDYMSKNQGQATNRLGSAVENRVTGAARGATNSVQGAQNQFNRQMDQGSLQNRDTAVSDAAKATNQARNIYTGDIAADTAAYQQRLAQAQADVASTNQFKEQETARLRAEQQRVNTEKAQALHALLKERNTALGYKEGQTQQQFDNYTKGGYLGSNAAYRDPIKYIEEQFKPKYAEIANAQNVLNTQDTRLSGLESQIQNYNKQLEMLANPDLVQAVDPALAQRFSDVINAQYTGPQSLRQAGLYDVALGNVNRAQDMLNQSKTAGGRQDLLTSMYGVDGQQYGRGLSGLDAALFNTNEQAVQNILDKGQEIGSLRGTLDRALVGSENAARNRAEEIRQISDTARSEFGTAQNAERASTESAIDQRQQDARDFINQLKSAFDPENRGTQKLSAAEAAILGIQEGEGLYNLGQNVVQERALNRDQLVSKDEQARLAALSSLAGMDTRNLLSTNNLYQDASKAGTQRATDALDRDAVRQALANAEQTFRDYAQNADISATGYGTGTSGGAAGTKRASAYKTLSANLGDVLGNSGYDLDSEINRNTLGSNDIVKNIVDSINYNPNSTGVSAPTSDAVRNMSDGTGSVNQPGLTASQLPTTPFQMASGDFWQDAGAELGNYLPGANLVGNTIGNVLNSTPFINDIGNAISSGISGSSSKAKAKAAASAASAAQTNLKNAIQDTLTGQGYYNRSDIDTNDTASLQRAAALEALLRRIG